MDSGIKKFLTSSPLFPHNPSDRLQKGLASNPQLTMPSETITTQLITYLDIVTDPNKILHQKLEMVPEITSEIKELISAMREKMVEANGIGLAANQIGKNLQIFVIDKKLAEENKVPDAFVNPEINDYSKEKDEMEEGCLSIPDYYRQIPRSKKIKIKALDENGQKIRFKAKGFLARVLQHETDHLNGLLIKDRV